jgi:chaperonin GroEL (HSP60 family)
MNIGKVKTSAKEVIVKGPELDSIILKTMKKISAIVGATLGPGGQPVLIERQEMGMPPNITKDGVTVFRALGAQNAAEHIIT